MLPRNKGNIQLIVIILVVIAAVIGYFAFKKYSPSVLPAPSGTATPTTQPDTNTPIIIEPKENSKVTSPLTVRGIVPPGWMFEGVFPIKLVDSNNNLISQAQAKEDVPGSWQSSVPAYFTATLTFTTKAKFGFIVLENDNPSGDPENSKNYQIKIYLSCTPRPACLDSNPRCLLPETEDMCPPSAQ